MTRTKREAVVPLRPAPRIQLGPAAGLGGDVRLAIRTLVRRPASTLTIASTLALGIGATTAIYAVFNYALFRPVPGVSKNAQLVHIEFLTADRKVGTSVGLSQLPALRAAASSAGLDRLAASCCNSEIAVSAPAGSQPTFATADFVTSGFFDVLGVRTRIGRLLTDQEVDAGSEGVVISERLWHARFDGRTDALGRTIDVNGHPFVVIGVMDRFRGWGHATPVGETDIWLPIARERAVTGEDSWIGDTIGRVPAGASLRELEQRVRAIYAHLPQTRQLSRFGFFMPFLDPGLMPAASQSSAAAALRLYWLLMSAVALLLVLACANAANLLLARSAQRARETAVRLAIGAGQWRVARYVLVESLGVSLLAGGLGLLAAILMTMTVRGMRLVSYFPDLRDIEIDGRVIVFCVIVAVTTVLIFGLLPSVMAARTDLRRVLWRSGRGVSSPHRLRRALVVAQIALSLTLVTGAGVLNRSLQNLLAADLGVRLDGVIDLELKPDLVGYSDQRASQIVADTMDGLRRAGFRDVAVSYPNPLTEYGGSIKTKTATMPAAEETKALQSSVSPDYFRVMGIPLAGRSFTEAERHEAESVNPMPVILSATLAREMFGGEPAVGRGFDLTRSFGPRELSSTALVIAVAGDTRSGSVRDAPRAEIYYARPSTYRYGAILTRSNDRTAEAMARIRGVVRDVDPALPITILRPLADEVAEDLSEDRALARLSASVALLAALLAATGVISVISQLVVERRRDFGIRTALGASAADILGHVLRGVVAQSMLGIGLGLGLYGGVSRWLAGRLFGLGALDPLTLVIAVGILLAVAVSGAVVPALHATHVDPSEALRAE